MSLGRHLMASTFIQPDIRSIPPGSGFPAGKVVPCSDVVNSAFEREMHAARTGRP
jgi:hypothetical protein